MVRHDVFAFVHRSFLELEQSEFHPNWHIKVLTAKKHAINEAQRRRTKGRLW
jgi:hypothetical protein